MSPVRSRAGSVLRAIGALAVLFAVVVGVPVLLSAVMPLLHMSVHGLPSLHDLAAGMRRRDNGQLAVASLVVCAWVCWALFVVSLVPELAGLARRRPAARLPGLGAFQRPAGALVAAIAIGFSLAPVAAGGGPASAATGLAAPPVPTSQNGSVPSDLPHSAAPRVDTARAPAQPVMLTYRVQRHDTLWGIAEKYLRDPLRYLEIARLNREVVGPDNEISPGDVLVLPADATGLSAGGADATQVTVEPGNTLAGLVDEFGGGGDWRAAWQVNAGRPEPHGANYDDPDLILPGWTLTVPSPHAASPIPRHTRTPVPHTAPSPPHPPPSRPHTPSRTSTAPSPIRPAATEATAPDSPSARPVHTSDASSHSGDFGVVAFAGGAGLVLAGVSLTAFLRYRRSQFRRRRPGRIPDGGPVELIPMERALIAVGRTAQPNVTLLDLALRSLVQSTADDPEGRLPDVIAVRLGQDDLELRLASAAQSAPAPWRVEDDARRWTIRRGDPLPLSEEKRHSYFAPYPTLVSVGYSAAGDHWLLDLERISTLSLEGDQERCANLGRFMAAELAHNAWSDMLQVTLVGLGRELVAANPDRLTYTDELSGVLDVVSRNFESVHRGADSLGTDALGGRLRDVVGDMWASHVVIVAPALSRSDELASVLKELNGSHRRNTVAVVLTSAGDPAEDAHWQLQVEASGRLRIPELALELFAEQIPEAEAAQLAQLLAYAADGGDAPTPPARGERPWDAHADACGNLNADSVSERSPADDRVDGDGDGWRQSILPRSPDSYTDTAATTEEDVRRLAPVVDDEIEDEVKAADPELDADLADWWSDDCHRPRITVLGEVKVRARGSLPERSPQGAFHTEAVAYLATRPASVPSNVFAESLWPNDPDVVGKPKVRQAVSALRKWLARDPETGEEYLPSGLHESGVARYCVEHALVDAELFRRLRVRGQSRGPAGIDDLWRALELVQGPPFDQLPMPRRNPATNEVVGPGGWAWLTEANARLDHEYAAMIVDTAHTIATHHLAAGEPELAAKAARVAIQSGTYEDVPLLDLVRASLALGKDAEAEVYVQQILTNHDAEVEEDLPPRTAEVLLRLRGHWVHRAG